MDPVIGQLAAMAGVVLPLLVARRVRSPVEGLLYVMVVWVFSLAGALRASVHAAASLETAPYRWFWLYIGVLDTVVAAGAAAYLATRLFRRDKWT